MNASEAVSKPGSPHEGSPLPADGQKDCNKEEDFFEDGLCEKSGDLDELQHYERIINTFLSYRLYCSKRLYSAILSVEQLPPEEREYYRNRLAVFKGIRKCINVNADFLESVAKEARQCFVNYDFEGLREKEVANDILSNIENEIGETEGDGRVSHTNSAMMPTENDKERLLSVVRHLYRDWSAEGAAERAASYDLILKSLQELFPQRSSATRILVPGAGLGRLTFEIALLGFGVQGNEFSLLMLFCSNFIINRCKEANSITFYPWISCYSNLVSPRDQLAAIKIPDVLVADSKLGDRYSMAAGDFLEVYQNTLSSFDCVACCFFLDTARSIVRYLQTIYRILKPSGYLINFGPLLWHFADVPKEWSIEPSWEEVREIIRAVGFVLVKEEVGLPAPYTQNPQSMLLYTYRCVFFVAQKPAAEEKQSLRS